MFEPSQLPHRHFAQEECSHCKKLNVKYSDLQKSLATTERLWREQRARADRLAAILRGEPI